MYPYTRLFFHVLKARTQPKLPPYGVHVSHTYCMPWDIDMFGEMNHGRILTLFDTGRFALAQRNGLLPIVLRNGWALTMAGVTVRYRKRILPFRRYEMRSRALGFDERFLYLEQSFYRDGECCASAMYRSAATEKGKLIPSAKLIEAMGLGEVENPLPDWVSAWADADKERPWPPEA